MRKHKIHIQRLTREYSVSTRLDAIMRKAVLKTLETEFKGEEEFEITILLADDEIIREANKEHRNIDKATDVLSFPMMFFKDGKPQEKLESFKNEENGMVYLGDIMLSIDRVLAQAEEYGHSDEREAAFLCVHSTLHLLGFNHENGGKEMKLMEDKQEQILEMIGLPR